MNASQRKTVLAGLLVLAAIAAAAAALLLLTGSPQLTEGPMRALPRTSATVVGVTTDPSVEQKLQIAKIASTPTTNTPTVHTMLTTVLGPTAPTDLPFLGPRAAWSWIPPNLNTADAVPVLALELSDTQAARTWADKNCPPATTIHDIVTVNNVDVLRIAKTANPDTLSGPTFDTDTPPLWKEINNSALAAGWADLAAVANLNASSAPAAENLYNWFILAPHTTGQVQASLTVHDTLVAVDGTGTDVNINGITTTAPNADLYTNLENLPDTATAAVAATDPARLAKNVDLIAQYAPTLTSPDTTLAAAGSTVAVAVGPALPGTARPVGWLTAAGSEQNSLQVANALFGNSADWTVTPATANMVAVANTAEWANKMAVPVSGKTLKNVDKFDQLVPDAHNASAAALFTTANATTGLWSSTTTVGFTMTETSNTTVTFKLRATLRAN